MTQILQRQDVLTRPGAVAAPARRPAPTPAPTRKFRPDIEGLRAYAVIAVVLYHAHLLGVRAGYVGVDVFFVISGFLITGQLLAANTAHPRGALRRFYAGRIRRLLPAAAVVLVATVAAARLWAPALQLRSIAVDAIYTTFYGLNYRLAQTGTQYLHQGDAVSPLQHFWSLAVEEQFYLIWPLALTLVALVFRRYRNVVLVVLLSAIVAGSLRYSITVTASAPPWAYFSLHTRAWELALGALVAVGAPRLARLPRRLGEAAAALGLLAVLGSAFLYSDATHYPGSAAALPVAGTALVIAAGCGPRRRAERMLAEPMLQCVGKVSYSWYLWHWPILILAPMVAGHPLDWATRSGLVLLSLAVALLSFFVVEHPIRLLKLANPRWLLTGLACSCAVLVAAGLVIYYPPSTVGRGAAVQLALPQTAGSSGEPAALAQLKLAVAAGLEVGAVPRNLTPQPAAAAADVPASSHDGCHADFLVIAQGACVFGDAHATRTAVLFGDSHMEQWLPAFDAAGSSSGWRIVSWTKAACPAATLSVPLTQLGRAYTECDSWRAATIARIIALKPQLILLSQSENVAPSAVAPAVFAADTVATMRSLAASSATLRYLDDIPVPNYDMPSCVAAHLTDAKACDFALSAAYRYPNRHRALAPAIRAAGFDVAEPAPWLCTATGCPAVIANYLVYRNSTHLSASLSRWLAPVVTGLLVTGH